MSFLTRLLSTISSSDCPRRRPGQADNTLRRPPHSISFKVCKGVCLSVKKVQLSLHPWPRLHLCCSSRFSKVCIRSLLVMLVLIYLSVYRIILILIKRFGGKRFLPSKCSPKQRW